jgi:type IV secretory pathway VirB4 component
MTSQDKEFIAEVYSLIVKIEDLIKKYNYEDRVMSAIMLGVIDLDLNRTYEEGEEVQLKSIFSYNLDSKLELEMVKDLMDQQFEDPDEDLEGLLGDLGISLN